VEASSRAQWPSYLVIPVCLYELKRHTIILSYKFVALTAIRIGQILNTTQKLTAWT